MTDKLPKVLWWCEAWGHMRGKCDRKRCLYKTDNCNRRYILAPKGKGGKKK